MQKIIYQTQLHLNNEYPENTYTIDIRIISISNTYGRVNDQISNGFTGSTINIRTGTISGYPFGNIHQISAIYPNIFFRILEKLKHFVYSST